MITPKHEIDGGHGLFILGLIEYSDDESKLQTSFLGHSSLYMAPVLHFVITHLGILKCREIGKFSLHIRHSGCVWKALIVGVKLSRTEHAMTYMNPQKRVRSGARGVSISCQLATPNPLNHNDNHKFFFK